MRQLLIEIDSPEDEAILLSLLPKLNARLVDPSRKKRSLGDVLDELAQTNIAEKYGDPSEWQRETRKDRPIAGREE